MIGKHVDLIAIALLLGALGICSHVANGVAFGLHSSLGAWRSPQYRGSHILIPESPHIPFARD